MNSAEELGHIAALQEGSRESFRWLYNQYFSQVYRFCKSLIPRVEDAEEVATDVICDPLAEKESAAIGA